jgi:hypothetical protein
MTQLNAQAQEEMATGQEAAPVLASPEAPVTAAEAAGLAAQTRNSFAIAGMVLGICSIVFCWWGLLTLAMVVMAITFGSIGIHRASGGVGEKGMAVAGVACGAFGGLLYLIVGVISLGVGFIL